MKHILLIDDRVFFGKAFAQFLEQNDFRVTVSRDGETDVGTSRNGPVDLVIMNVAEGGSERLETVAALRQDLPQSRFIALADGRREDSWQARRLGVDHAFHAAFNTEGIMETIERDLRAAGFPPGRTGPASAVAPP